MPKYSELFDTIHDETNETEEIGCAYTVLRAKDNTSESENAFFDFVIIWDYDHDERIIRVLEDLYNENKLHYFLFVGERKGVFRAVLNPAEETDVSKLLGDAVDAEEDTWVTEVIPLDQIGNGNLILASKKNSEKYIQNIQNKFTLGKRQLKIKKSKNKRDDSETELDDAVHKLKLSDAKTKKQSDPRNAIAQLRKVDKEEVDEEKVNVFSEKIAKKTGRHTESKRKVSFYGFPNKAKAQEKELEWERRVSNKFFRIGKKLLEGKESYKIHKKINEYIEKKSPAVLNLDGYCRRSLMIALSKIISENKGLPAVLTFQLGSTVIKLIPSSGTQNQIGNFKMEVDHCYDIKYGEGLIKRIGYLIKATYEHTINNHRKTQLLKLIQNKLKKFNSFQYRDFNPYGNIACYDDKKLAYCESEKIKENIALLNGLIFLITTVEVLVRLYRDENGQLFNYANQNAMKSDSFPVAMAQARSICLLLTGEIGFNDFLGESQIENYNANQHRAYYGAVTGTSTIANIEIMLEKLCAINQKYNARISKANFWGDFTKEYLEANPTGYFVEGKSGMYMDLWEIYGSGSETSDESSEYSSDGEEVIKFNAKK